MSAPERSASVLDEPSESQGEPLLVEARAELVIARLIAYSRLLQDAARQGSADRIDELMDKRRELIDGLGAPEDPLPVGVRERLDELAEEDARTIQALADWRDRTRQDLQAVPELKTALAGYARPAGPKTARFERDF